MHVIGSTPFIYSQVVPPVSDLECLPQDKHNLCQLNIVRETGREGVGG